MSQNNPPAILPCHEMREQLKALRLKCQDKDWFKVPENKAVARAILERSKEGFYSFEPYFNRSNGTPSWQWNFMMAANDYRGRVALGANRIGKSEMGAYECALAITGKHPVRHYPADGLGWIVGLDNTMIREIDRPLFEKFLPSRYKTRFSKQENVWVCNGDGREWRIVFKSTEMGPDKFQGAKLDFCWIDEEPKKTDIFNEIKARLVDKAGIWFITATPVRGTAWLKALSQSDGVFTTFAGMRENPYLPIAEVEALAAELPEDERDVRIEGKYVTFGGNPVFSGKLIRALIQKAEESELFPLEGTLQEVA